MESRGSPEHFIPLPLVNKEDDNPIFPLVIDVVCRYWGQEIPKPAASRGIKGSVLIDGIELAEKHGFVSYIYKGSLKDLKRRIDQGIPPIVVLPGIQDLAQHAVVVSGYNDEERRVLTYVPEPDTVGAVPESKFEQDWQQDDMVTIVLVPDDMKDLLKKEDLKFSQSNRMCFEAERLRQQGKTNEAIEKLQKTIEIDSDNAQAWCLLAGIYNEMNSDEAVKCYEKTVKLNPKYYLAYRGLGNYYLKKKDYSLAEAYYTKTISTNPMRFGPVYKNRAIVRMQVNNNQGAKEDLLKYLELTPNAADMESIRTALNEL